MNERLKSETDEIDIKIAELKKRTWCDYALVATIATLLMAPVGSLYIILSGAVSIYVFEPCGLARSGFSQMLAVLAFGPGLWFVRTAVSVPLAFCFWNGRWIRMRDWVRRHAVWAVALLAAVVAANLWRASVKQVVVPVGVAILDDHPIAHERFGEFVPLVGRAISKAELVTAEEVVGMEIPKDAPFVPVRYTLTRDAADAVEQDTDDTQSLVLDVCGTHCATLFRYDLLCSGDSSFTVLAHDPTGELRDLLLSAPTNAAIRFFRTVGSND